MTIEEFVEDISAISDEQRLIQIPTKMSDAKNHLLQYLRHLEHSDANVMLVGEAPGYLGCVSTGIPFTDEVQLKLPENFYALGHGNDQQVLATHRRVPPPQCGRRYGNTTSFLSCGTHSHFTHIKRGRKHPIELPHKASCKRASGIWRRCNPSLRSRIPKYLP